jgi:hypothetical protein
MSQTNRSCAHGVVHGTVHARMQSLYVFYRFLGQRTAPKRVLELHGFVESRRRPIRSSCVLTGFTAVQIRVGAIGISIFSFTNLGRKIARQVFLVGKGIAVRNGKTNHLNDNTVVNESIGHIFTGPCTMVLYNAVRPQIKDNDTLPPREEYHTLDAQKLAQRPPIDGMPEFLVDGRVEHDETIERVHDGNVLKETEIGIGDAPIKGTGAVYANRLKEKGEYGRDNLAAIIEYIEK